RARVVLDQGSCQGQVCGRIGARALHGGPRSCDLLTQRVLGPTLTSAGQTAHRDRAEMELQALVPVLLLGCAEGERPAALHAGAIFIDVEVFRDVTHPAEHLLAHVASHGTARQRWATVRIWPPP